MSELNFEQVYHDYKDLVFNLALSYAQNQEDAEEITQDVFIRIHQKLTTFQNNSSVKTWVYRITINISLDHLKSKQTKKRKNFLSALFQGSENKELYNYSDFSHPGVALENKESVSIIFRCINQLPEQQKTALILNKLEDKSQKEIAEIMETTPKAVESLIQRAKIKLKKILNDARDG